MAGWTKERVDLLTAMWTAGETFGAIRQALGGVSRNAVIGKAHRLGLVGRGGAKLKAAGGGMPKPRAERLPPVTPLSERVAAIEADLPATDDLTSRNGCRWPIGDPKDIATGGFRFCQRTRAEGSPYCDVHREVSCGPQPKARAKFRDGRCGGWQ